MMERNVTPLALQKGFTLLELLLSIGLLAFLLAGMYQLFDTWMQRAVDRYAAADMLRVQNASQDYVLANFDTFKADALNTFIEIDINALKTFNYLPTGYQPRNAFKQSIRAFRRNIRVNKLNKDGTNAVDSNGNPIYIFSMEVVTVSDNPASGTIRVPNKRLLDTAQAGGPRMGVVTSMVMGGTTFTGRATSLFSEWYVDLLGLSAAGYAAAPDASGGYLASYGIVSNEGTDANDAWLYRVDVTNRPELNRMDANLLMNSNPVESVGTIIADKFNVTGNATFRGQAQGVAAETAQAMTVEQALRVDGATESRINMKDTSGGCTFAPSGPNRSISGAGCTISGGEVQVISAASAANDATMNIGTLTADGSVITDITNVTNTTDARGVSTFNSLTGTTMTATDQIVTPITTVTGATIQTQQMQIGNMAVSAASTVTGNIVSAQAKPGNGRSLTTQRMDIANAATFNGNIQTNAINATKSVYINNVELPGGAPTTYLDTVMNRTIRCTPYNGKTYCEPTGAHTWPNGVTENCAVGATGYSCNFFDASAVFIGTCTYSRTTGASGQAYHTVSCT